MSAIPSISDSALLALQRGSAQVNRGAAEIVSASTVTSSPDVPQDIVDIRSGSAVDTEPMLTGVRDLMLGRLQFEAGTVLLHAYSENRQSLYDMLKPD